METLCVNGATPTEVYRKPVKTLRAVDKSASEARKVKGTLLALQKPSYCLRRGNRNFSNGEGSLRYQNRRRLLHLLQEYMRRHMWEEACAVLSVLQQATVRETSPSTNRIKFKAVLQLLRHMKGNAIPFRKIWKIYDLWMMKLRLSDAKERLSVQSELILHCLQHGYIEDAYRDILGFMQLHGFDSDPQANWVAGLLFCRLWYSRIPEELQLKEMGSSFVHSQSEVALDIIFTSNNFSDNGTSSYGTDNDSHTSVALDKGYGDEDKMKSEPLDIKDNMEKGISHINAELSTVESDKVEIQDPEYMSSVPGASIFSTRGLPVWLLPMNLPNSDEDLDTERYMHGKLLNEYYTSALKYLRSAVYSTPPKIDAFHPLIQMLLLGDQVNEALFEVEKFCKISSSECPLRIKAGLLEHFNGGNYTELCECYEDILKKKPSCGYSVERLIYIHQQGMYGTKNLVKMIATHLDASSGACNAWQCLASCFWKLSECDGDRASTCHNSGNFCSQEIVISSNKVPELFTNPSSRHSWRIRARWWLVRHFDSKNLQKDMTSDDLKMLTYKAAAASYIYGRQFSYVASAIRRLEERDNMELYSFLQMHILNSVGYFFKDQ